MQLAKFASNQWYLGKLVTGKRKHQERLGEWLPHYLAVLTGVPKVKGHLKAGGTRKGWGDEGQHSMQLLDYSVLTLVPLDLDPGTR